MHKQSCWHCKPVYCADVPFDASWTRELLRAERHVPTELWLGEAFVWTLHIFSPCHGSLIGCFAEDYRVPTIEFRRCVERCTALVSATFWSIASNFGFQTSNALLSKKKPPMPVITSGNVIFLAGLCLPWALPKKFFNQIYSCWNASGLFFWVQQQTFRFEILFTSI